MADNSWYSTLQCSAGRSTKRMVKPTVFGLQQFYAPKNKCQLTSHPFTLVWIQFTRHTRLHLGSK